MKRHLTEIAWVVGGQAFTALGTVVGVRILTQALNPSAYGTVSLALGLSTLAINLVAAPLTQAAIHFYPNVVAEGSVRELLASVLRCYRVMAPWILSAALVGGIVYVASGQGTPVLVILLTLLFASDCWRSANLSLLYAARRQRRSALWMAGDSWSRPLAAAAAVLAFGQSPVAVLAAYVLVSAGLVTVFSHRLWPQGRDDLNDDSLARSRGWDSRLWKYALPLIPLGIVSWASTLGDRYIIGGMLGIADAGVYAAVYGLSSIPFLLVSGTAEQGLRPIYQMAVSRGDRARASRILLLWFAIVVAVCCVGVLVFAFGHETIASLVVAVPYRRASGLMPWIATGYAIRAISSVPERVCYAYGETRRVLFIQVLAVAATAVVTPLGILTLGIRGAAMAVPVYFSIQLTIAAVLARRTIREAAQRSQAVHWTPTASTHLDSSSTAANIGSPESPISAGRISLNPAVANSPRSER
jgi:O-antigen/teichoic acid export membrane protein